MERIPILKKPMKKHHIQRMTTFHDHPREIAVLMRRRKVSADEAKRLITAVESFGIMIGERSNQDIAEWAGAEGNPHEFIDDMIAAGVLRWCEDKELALVPQEDE